MRNSNALALGRDIALFPQALLANAEDRALVDAHQFFGPYLNQGGFAAAARKDEGGFGGAGLAGDGQGLGRSPDRRVGASARRWGGIIAGAAKAALPPAFPGRCAARLLRDALLSRGP